MKFTYDRSDRGLIRLDKERNSVSWWHIRYPCNLGMGWCWPWLASLPLGTWALTPQYKQSSFGIFFIIGLSCGVEILRSGISCFKDFRKPSLVPRGVIMNYWRIVKFKGVYCLVFSWAVGLIVHSILYKVFLNESFVEYFCYVYSFVMNSYLSYSKLLCNCGIYFSKGRSIAVTFMSSDFAYS
jgi:hypothetical protein